MSSTNSLIKVQPSDSYNLLSHKQYRFRSVQSTADIRIAIPHNVSEAIDNEYISSTVAWYISQCVEYGVTAEAFYAWNHWKSILIYIVLPTS